MRFLYALINLPLRFLAMILAYKCHTKGTVLPDWLSTIIDKQPITVSPAPPVEAYDSSGKRVKNPKRLSV